MTTKSIKVDFKLIRKKMKVLSLFFILFFSVYSSILSKEITGTVFGDEGENKKTPLPGARLTWLGTKSGGLTDNMGMFKLAVPVNSGKLIISYTGYRKDTLDVKDMVANMEIVLVSELKTSDVVVESEQPATLSSLTDAMKTTTITKKGLLKAACCNLSESFQTNPSVDVSYSDALTGAKQIQLLGLQGIYIQMLNEKVPNFRGLASTYGLNYVPGPWMESIQISKGSASVSTGYESITGQINIEYKKPETAERFYGNLYGDGYGRLEGNFNSGMNVTDKLSTMLFLHGDFFNTKLDLNHDGFLDKPLVQTINVFNRWNYSSGNGYESRIGIKALYEDREGGQTGFFPSENPGLFGIDIKTQRYEFYTKNGFIYDNRSSLGTIVSASYHNQQSFYGKNIYDGTQTSGFLNVIYEAEPVEKVHKYSVGLSYMYDFYNENLNDSLMKRTESVPGAYAEYTFSPYSTLTLIGGIRADYHNIYGTFVTPRFHLRYSPTEKISIRASAGKGYHTPSIFAENIGLLASSRKFISDEKLKPEQAWNYGINSTIDFALFDIDMTLNAEYYRTDFNNQIIVDIDRNPAEVHFYNLNGISYSNSYQVDLTFQPVKHFDVTLAYRFNDVKMTIDGKLLMKPLVSRMRGFLNLAYAIGKNDWKFDLTLDYNGSGRIPVLDSIPVENQPSSYWKKSEFPAYVLVNAQITKSFGNFDMYLGGENLTNFMQMDPILAYNQPFGKNFDSSMIWGPIMGRLFYLGIRYSII